MITLLLHVLRLLPFLFGGHRQLAVENLALRQQLAVYKRTTARPKLRTTDRLSFAKMVMGLRPTLHHENRLSSPRADARPRR